MAITQTNPITPSNPKGAGRPAGKVALERKLQLRELSVMKMRIYHSTRKLINSQIILATGFHKIAIKTIDPETNRVKLEVVNEQKKIEELLETGIYGEDYIVIVGAKPDGDIANKLLDRAYGKAKETIDLGLDVKFSILDLAKRAEELEKKQAIDAVATETENPLQIENTSQQ